MTQQVRSSGDKCICFWQSNHAHAYYVCMHAFTLFNQLQKGEKGLRHPRYSLLLYALTACSW